MKYSAIDNGITQFLSLEPLGVDGALSGSAFRYISVLLHFSFTKRNAMVSHKRDPVFSERTQAEPESSLVPTNPSKHS